MPTENGVRKMTKKAWNYMFARAGEVTRTNLLNWIGIEQDRRHTRLRTYEYSTETSALKSPAAAPMSDAFETVKINENQNYRAFWEQPNRVTQLDQC